MRELLILESIKQKMQNSNIQILRNGAKNKLKNTRAGQFSRFANSMISHEILNNFARCKHQTCSILNKEHNHGL